MTVTAQSVKDLRERTNAPMMDCKAALTDADGNMDKAVELLRKRGLDSARRRAGRIAAEGYVGSYIHGEGRIGVLLEVNSETDFVARTEQFQTLVQEIAMQIAATPPLCVSRDDVPEEELEAEKVVLAARLKDQGKPEKIIPKILEGQINKWYKDVCLLDQTYNRDKDKTIADLINEVSAATGEKIVVRRFARFELGEGIEKKESDLRAEVQGMIKD